MAIGTSVIQAAGAQSSMLFISEQIVSLPSSMQPLEGDRGMESMPEQCAASGVFVRNRNGTLKF